SYYSLANYPGNNFTFRKVLYYEQVGDVELLELLKTCTKENRPFSSADLACVTDTMTKATAVMDILNGGEKIDGKGKALTKHIQIASQQDLRRDLEKAAIGEDQAEAIQHKEEEDAELEEIGAKPMGAVELMTIVGAKGLSADHVIIIGFDNVNMHYVT